MPSLLEETKYGRGFPVAYTLAPLDYLRSMYGLQLAPGVSVGRAPEWFLQQFIHIWETWTNLTREVKHSAHGTGPIDFLLTGPSLQRLSDTGSHLQDALGAKDKFLKDFDSALVDLRSTQGEGDALIEFLDEHRKSSNSPIRVADTLVRLFNEVYLRKTLAAHGGQYLDYESSQIAISTGIDMYVMFFTGEMQQDDDLWQEYQEVLIKLLTRNPGDYNVAIAECNRTELSTSRPRILFYSLGEVKISDMIKVMDFADQNFMKREFKCTADKGHPAPRDRRLVNFPCPCDEATPQEWTCYHCRGVLEYHDRFFYCECGRTDVRDTTWQCNSEAHGKRLVR